MIDAPAALHFDDVTIRYGRATAVSGVTLNVPVGSVVALVGNNGAGKTTLLHSAVGLLRPARGRIFAFGADVTRKPPSTMIDAGVALVPEGRHVIPGLRTVDNLLMGYRHDLDEPVDQRLEAVLEIFPEIKPHLNRRGGLLSGGQQQMVAIGRALMAKPKLLLLDEPGHGLSPLLVERVFSRLAELATSGLSILVAEQLARAAFGICDCGHVMRIGQVIASGAPSELMTSGALEMAYFSQEGDQRD